MKVYVVTARNFVYNDEYYYPPEEGGGDAYRAYRNKASAEKDLEKSISDWYNSRLNSGCQEISSYFGYDFPDSFNDWSVVKKIMKLGYDDCDRDNFDEKFYNLTPDDRKLVIAQISEHLLPYYIQEVELSEEDSNEQSTES